MTAQSFSPAVAVGRLKPHWWRVLGWLALVVAWAGFGSLASPHALSIAVLAATIAGLATAFNIVYGYAGLLSLAQVGLWGIGGYTSALLVTRAGYPIWVAVMAAGALGGVAALVLGQPALRLSRPAFIIVSLSFTMLIQIAARGWVDLTRGPLGIPGLPVPSLSLGPVHIAFERPQGTYYLMGALVLVVLLVFWQLTRSRIALALLAVRDDDVLAESLGLKVHRLRLGAFVFSGTATAFIGGLFVFHLSIVDPSIFGWFYVQAVVVPVVISGPASFWGPVAAATAFVVTPEVFRMAGEVRLILFGAVLILVTYFMPDGLAGLVRRRSSTEPRTVTLVDRGGDGSGFNMSTQTSERQPRALLDATGMTKRYAGSVALADFSLSVARGEVVGLVGPNGSGKSSFIDCVCGAQRPDAGKVLLKGEDVTSRPPHSIVLKGLARTFQEPRYFAHLTLLDHFRLAHQAQDGHGLLAAYFRLRSVRASEEHALEKAYAALEESGLESFANALPGDLSYGQSKLFAIALALAGEPEVLFLDEPLAGVSPSMVERVEQRLLDVRNAGQTIVIVEHNLDFVASIATRVVVMSAGELIADGPPDVLWSNAAVFEALIGGGDA